MVLKIIWLRDGGHPHEIGGSPLFAPGPVVEVAGEYVVKRVWPQIHRDHPEVSGFALVDLPSRDEVFRWKDGHDVNAPPM
jgi:hypothetical protein